MCTFLVQLRGSASIANRVREIPVAGGAIGQVNVTSRKIIFAPAQPVRGFLLAAAAQYTAPTC
jgi:hypothetical protein